MNPPELAGEIIPAVTNKAELDLEPIRAELLTRLEEPSEEYIWPRAERIAEDAIDSIWPAELHEQCAQGLQRAHEQFLRAAAQCLDAADDLEANGRESWIARAVRHHFAFEAVWDTLDERHGVESHECQA